MIVEKKNNCCPPRSIFITFLLGCCVFFYIEHCSSALNNDSTSSNTFTDISSSTSNSDTTVFTGLGPASRCDQEEKENLRVRTSSGNQEPTKKEYRRSIKHNKITENAPEEENAIMRQQGILVMVMGEACNYHRWRLLWNSFLMHETKMESASAPAFAMKDNRLWSQSTTSSQHYPDVTNQEYQSKSNSFFVYASYDEPVSAANVSLSSCTPTGDNGAMDKHKCCNCSSNATNTSSSSTIFIPGTTWTQGRNKLIEEALHLERMFGQKYDYWLFLDDDAVFQCRHGQDAVMKHATNCNDMCWNEFMDVLKDRSLVPRKATTVTLNRRRKSEQHLAASNADAMVAAFKREYVPYLLPYATLNVSDSEWTSQAVLFCVMWSCFRQSTYFIPNIRVRNKAHRPYERGWNISSFQAATAHNYDQYMSLHRGCDESKHYEQMSDVVNASSVKELDDLIPAMNQSCTVLKQHFSDWAVQTVGLTAT